MTEQQIKKDKWLKRWKVNGSNDNIWTVATDKTGNYGCSCPVWKFRRQECHHILLVKNGGGMQSDEPRPRPEYILAKVNKPIYKAEENKLLVPLIGLPDANMMDATICYYLLKHGYSMSEIREMRRIPHDWTARAIMAHVETHGEAEYPEGWYDH